MTPKSKPLFDPKIFLANVGEGKTIAEYSKDQTVFLARRPGERRILYPKRQNQALRRLQRRQRKRSSPS